MSASSCGDVTRIASPNDSKEDFQVGDFKRTSADEKKDGFQEGHDHDSLVSSNIPAVKKFTLGDFYHKYSYQNDEVDEPGLRIIQLDPECKHLPPGLYASFIWEKNKSEITVTFRGTSDSHGVKRDGENEGAGHESFWLPKTTEFLTNALNNALKTIHTKHNKPITVNVSGHSLGAADSSNFVALLVDRINTYNDPDNEELDHSFSHINSINLIACNTPGISFARAKKANQDVRAIKQKQLLDINCYWVHAKNDPVQATGQTSIFSDADPTIANHHMLYIAYISDSWNWLKRALKAHTNKFLISAIEYWCYTNNNTPAGREFISQRLQNKSIVLQSWPVRLAQYVLSSFLNSGNKSTSSITQNTDNLPDEPAVLVESKEEEEFQKKLKEDDLARDEKIKNFNLRNYFHERSRRIAITPDDRIFVEDEKENPHIVATPKESNNLDINEEKHSCCSYNSCATWLKILLSIATTTGGIYLLTLGTILAAAGGAAVITATAIGLFSSNRTIDPVPIEPGHNNQNSII